MLQAESTTAAAPTAIDSLHSSNISPHQVDPPGLQAASPHTRIRGLAIPVLITPSSLSDHISSSVAEFANIRTGTILTTLVGESTRALANAAAENARVLTELGLELAQQRRIIATAATEQRRIIAAAATEQRLIIAAAVAEQGRINAAAVELDSEGY